MNESNLVRRISYLTPGDGFRRVHPLHLLSNVRDASGLVLTGSTVPAVAALESNFYGLSVVTGQTFMGKFSWVIPQDYDEDIDSFNVLVACNMAGNTNSGLTITPTIYRKRPIPAILPDDPATAGTFPAALALSADLGCPTSTTTIPLLGSNLLTKWVDINCARWASPIGAESGQATSNRSLSATADASLKCGDCIQVGLALSAAHATDACYIYGIEVWYRSNLAFTNISSR
jgi:hypothetical protein